MHYGILFLSKVIDNNDPKVFNRFNIVIDDFPTEVERKVFRFIEDYANANRGQAPSYATVAAEIPEFGEEYVPDVTDSYEFLAREIKDYAAKIALKEYLPKLVEKFNAGESGKSLLRDLRKNIESITIRTSVREKIGTNIKTDSKKFLDEYERRKAGKSFRIWKSKFSPIGEYVSSNLYTVYGKSGRGKSVITLEDAKYAAQQGANVLIWAMEMGWFEVMVRLYVSISGEQGVTTAHMHGLDLAAGFDARELRLGKLSEEFEQGFRTFLETIDDIIPGNITIRAVDDEEFSDRSLRALEADIEATKADFVVIDPFYYLHYERNTSKTAGGDAANTSMRLRALAGRTSTVIIAITQADETKETDDENGNRELALPERKDVKKTKALLEDAYLLIGIDSDYKQGRGLVGVFKGRDGGEGEVSEILYIPQVGVVREMETGESVVGDFEF